MGNSENTVQRQQQFAANKYLLFVFHFHQNLCQLTV